MVGRTVELSSKEQHHTFHKLILETNVNKSTLLLPSLSASVIC